MKYLVGLLFGLSFNLAVAPAQKGALESLTIEDGLSQGMVYDILQARDGFLWIATKDGLNRYDGYNFHVWTNDPANPFSPAGNTISALFEDSRGWLWIGYESEGVDLFDRKNNRFYHLSLPIAYKQGQQAWYDIRQIVEDTDGNIWIANRGGGVFRLQIPPAWATALPDIPALNTLVACKRVAFPSANHPDEVFQALLPMPDATLWVGSSKHLYRVDIRTLASSRIQRNSRLPEETWHLIRAKSGEIWGASSTGLFRHRNGDFEYFPLTTGARRLIDTNPALCEDKNGQVWVLLENKLWRVPANGVVNPKQPDYQADQSGNVLCPDDQGNIWVGTLGYGLRKLTPRKSMFHSMLEGVSIWGVWENQAGVLFCKLYNKIVRYDPVSGRLSDQSAFPDALPQQNDLLYGPTGDYWLLCGLRDERINLNQLRHYQSDGQLLAVYDIPIDRYPYARLMRTRDGAIWASGTSGQLLRLHPETGAISTFNFGALFGNNAHKVLTFALAEDGNGHVWAGTQLGLVRGTPRGNDLVFQLFKAETNTTQSLNHNSIACLLPDPDDPQARLWIGTKGGGINCLDLRSGVFSHITTKQGLPNDVVYGLLTDDAGNLWCSTNRGLAKLLLNGVTPVKIIPFSAADGLQNNEFNTHAFFKAPGGELLFGGINGLNRFLPADLKFSANPPSVYIIGIKINADPLPAPVEYLRHLKLDYRQNNLAFEFSALDFSDPAKNQYRYQLLPIEKNWIASSKDHVAYYTHLDPGHYVFRVQGSNSTGTWQETPVELQLVILPPWWRSKPAHLFYVLLLAILAWQIWRFQIRRVQLREQLVYEHRETERIKALEQAKTNFFNNITHEFRTPLTLILEPARRIASRTQEPEIRENAAQIENNGLRLLNLVNQLLDLAKLESGSITLDLRQHDFTETVRTVFEAFQPLATERNIEFGLSVPARRIDLICDAGKVELILNNLISNALKFTPPGGRVQVYCALEEGVGAETIKTGHDSPGVIVQVADTGIGIPPGALGKVFDRFFQVDGSNTHRGKGSGIGLALSRELATRMGGGIEVRSEVAQGSTFTFWLPVLEKRTALSDTGSPANETEPAGFPTRQLGDAEQPLVLIIEDNSALRQFIRQAIGENWQVIEAADGEAGIQLATEHIPDLVVSDLMMPRMDGYAVCDTLKNNELTAHIPVILLTAKAGLDSRIKGLRTGADDYLTKPFHTDELVARMENLVAVRRKLQQRYDPHAASGSATPVLAPPVFLSPPDREFLRRLTDTLEQNLSDETLGVEEFARKMFVSRVQLHRKLKALTNQSATDFIRDYRLNKAMALLKKQEGRVSDVASRVGFSNEKYFSTVFKEKFGVSPSQVAP